MKTVFFVMLAVLTATAAFSEKPENKTRILLQKRDITQETDFFQKNQDYLKTKYPGLYGKWLEKSGKIAEACLFYKKILEKEKSCPDGVKLRLAKCLSANKELKEAYFLYDDLIQNDVLGRRIEVLYEPIKFAYQNSNLKEKRKLEKAVLAIRTRPLNREQREMLAELLTLSASNSALEKLFTELLDTKKAQEMFNQTRGIKWWRSQKSKKILSVGRSLSNLNQNDTVIEVLSPLLKTKLKKRAANCEAKYLIGKAYRRKREYRKAKNILRPVVRRCSGTSKRSAFYVLSRLVAMDQSKKSIPVFNKFLRSYPKHSFADDVMLWKINVLKKVGTKKQIEKAYKDYFADHKGGDKYEETLFNRAFYLASHSKTKEAIVLLQDEKNDRALYWKGRLSVYPNINSFAVNKNKKEKHAGVEILEKLSHDKPNSYYGHMSWKVLKNIGSNDRRTLKRTTKAKSLKTEFSNLKTDPGFKNAECLSSKGFDEEAIIYLDYVNANTKLTSKKLDLAINNLLLKRDDITHQIMRRLGFAFPWNYNVRKDVLQWQLAFPKAYEEEFQKATVSSKIPEYLLMGLCREESAFDKNALSWAGARGLCQMLPKVGAMNAKRLNLKYDSHDLLFDPEVNIVLAADYLSRDIKRLKSPVLAIAAYNGGTRSVENWVKAVNKPFPVDTFVEQIPYAQTKDYVKKVTSSWLSYAWLYDEISNIEIPLYVN